MLLYNFRCKILTDFPVRDAGRIEPEVVVVPTRRLDQLHRVRVGGARVVRDGVSASDLVLRRRRTALPSVPTLDSAVDG